MNSSYLLVAKYEHTNDAYHPLLYHMLDVVNVSSIMFKTALPEFLRLKFTSAFNLHSEEEFIRWCSFWCGLHDLGKATPAFQKKFAHRSQIMAEHGLDISMNCQEIHHGELTYRLLQDVLSQIGLSVNLSSLIAQLVSGHHGKFPQWPDVTPRTLGIGNWDLARRQIIRLLMRICRIDLTQKMPSEGLSLSALIPVLAGLCSVADWIGSMTDFFPFTKKMRLTGYLKKSVKSAQEALSESGWTDWHIESNGFTFKDLFGFENIRPLQKSLEQVATRLDSPSLIIIEAPTGDGKTECAFYINNLLSTKHLSKGAYVAMPTQATSDQMFSRMIDFLTPLHNKQQINLHLIHGNAAFSKEYRLLQIASSVENSDETLIASEWFTKPKRGVLSPYAVGTVDQTFLAILKSKHFFVRIFGLSGKTVIFDEVHAYDTYMDTLFERLLEWFGAIGTSVVILSATLPAEKRKRFIGAYSGSKNIAEDRPYPRISISDESSNEIIPIETSRPVEIHIEMMHSDSLREKLTVMLCNGGCVAIIRNTVKRAQECYENILQSGIVKEDEIILLHSRFLQKDRQSIQDKVIKYFGKEGKRPNRVILVSTQIIEQSLDIDFDGMISDISPVDLLIQRAGRLHRHNRAQLRPKPLKKPVLHIIIPQFNTDGIPDFKSQHDPYEDYFLLATFFALRFLKSIKVPTDIDRLINLVYEESTYQSCGYEDTIIKILNRSRKDLEEEMRKSIYIARRNIIGAPSDDYESSLTDQLYLEEDESPQISETLRALTRLAESTVTIVCIEARNEKHYLWGTESEIDLKVMPDINLTRELLQHSVKVSRWSVLRHFFSDNMTPSIWKKSAFLRNVHVAIFKDGNYQGNGFTMKLDSKVGLTVE